MTEAGTTVKNEGDILRGDSSGSLRKRLSRRSGPLFFVLAVAVVYFIVFAAFTMNRHEVYSSARFDLGNMDQAVWNTSEGRILENTSLEGENRSRLANHADFLLIAFAPLYWISASPHWLLAIQAAVVALGALPLYWIARRFLKRDWPAALIAAAYLFNPGLQSANTFDFHSQTLAGTFLLFTFHYLLERRLWPFVVFAVLASFCKEEISLLVAMMGLYMLFVERRARWGIPVFAAGVAYFLFVMFAVIPAFNEGAVSELVTERYGPVGGSIGGVFMTALTDPISVLGHAFSTDKILYLTHLVGLGGILGIFSPAILLVPLPEIAINLLANRDQMTNINYHYSAPIIPFMYVGCAAGLAVAARFFSKRNVSDELLRLAPLMFAGWVLFMNAYMAFGYGPLPFAQFHRDNPVAMQSLAPERIENIDEAVALVPDDAKVSASNWIAPHLAHRTHLYLFPTINDADYVVVDLGRASYFTDVKRERAQQALQTRLIENPDYEPVFSESNVAVFRRVSE
ncbi:MAG: DUF2079 domain-containing protein [Rubrobacter sp.]|jgi:uncharacterized membrane protein|nr:DUF2079 domain-containing protein [Rubrobacter sp.]